MTQQKAGVSQLLHYRLIRKIGEGGMGAVYLADDTQERRKVALKVLPRKHGEQVEFLKRFQREADAASRLRHPNIVGAYAAGQDQGYHFYAMEYCEGEPLDKSLRRDQKLPVFRAVEIVKQVAEGLKHAHAQGFIHRDIKPSNIMLTPAGTARILDLGLSKNLEDTHTSFRTADGAVVGTPHYISPEQASGEKKIDGRTDIYSLGATLYHLLTGEAPFEGSSTVEVLYKHVHSLLPNPQDARPELPDGIVHVIRRMMAKDPEDRYRTCDDLITDLDELIGGKTPPTVVLDAKRSSVALQRGAVPRAKAPMKVPRFFLLFAGASAAVILILLGVYLAMPEEDPPPVPAVAGDPWKNAVNLLELIDPARDAVAGPWKLEGGALVAGEELTARLEFPYRPPEEYDFKIVFTRRTAKDVVNQILSRRGKAFLWQMAGWDNVVFGFSEIDGKRADENPSTVRIVGGLENGRAYTSVVEVRKDRITAFLDGRKLAEWKTDGRDLGMNDDWRLRDESLLGVGAWGGGTAFESVLVREVTGKGTPTRKR